MSICSKKPMEQNIKENIIVSKRIIHEFENDFKEWLLRMLKGSVEAIKKDIEFLNDSLSRSNKKISVFEKILQELKNNKKIMHLKDETAFLEEELVKEKEFMAYYAKNLQPDLAYLEKAQNFAKECMKKKSITK